MQNTLRANLVGRLVSTDFRSAMIATELLEVDPETQKKLDYFKVANLLEKNIRDKYVNDTIPT